MDNRSNTKNTPTKPTRLTSNTKVKSDDSLLENRSLKKRFFGLFREKNPRKLERKTSAELMGANKKSEENEENEEKMSSSLGEYSSSKSEVYGENSHPIIECLKTILNKQNNCQEFFDWIYSDEKIGNAFLAAAKQFLFHENFEFLKDYYKKEEDFKNKNEAMFNTYIKPYIGKKESKFNFDNEDIQTLLLKKDELEKLQKAEALGEMQVTWNIMAGKVWDMLKFPMAKPNFQKELVKQILCTNLPEPKKIRR